MKNWTKESALAHIAENTIVLENGCHEWQGSKTKAGYGQLSRDTLTRTFGIKGVHRLVVHLVYGHVFTSRDEQVMHSCHFRACCNPAHLSVGTAAENMAEASARHRGCNTGWNRGEQHVGAKLTEDIVREVKRLMAYGWTNQWIHQNVPGLEVVRKNAISNIRTGRRWRHVTL